MKQRKHYTKEFKLDAVSLVTDQGYSQAEAGRRLDVNANMIGRWIKELSDTDGQAFRGNGKLTPDQEEIKKLRVEVKRLKMERSDGVKSLASQYSFQFRRHRRRSDGVKSLASQYSFQFRRHRRQERCGQFILSPFALPYHNGDMFDLVHALNTAVRSKGKDRRGQVAAKNTVLRWRFITTIQQ